MKNKLSIIIPVLNEAESIGSLLTHLFENATPKNIAEIIIVDGGSTDGTIEKVENILSGRAQSRPNTNLSATLQEKILLLNAPKGRAKQMNHGAKQATGNILYFLHADSFPPKHFDQHIINEVNKGHLAGCFRLQFNNNHWWLGLAGWFTQFSWQLCRGGDQSQFITKTLFKDIGGYDESYVIYEDNILINELYKRKQFTVINKKIKTSARLYERHGIWKLQYHFWAIHLKKYCGASANELYTYYKKHIA